jgi:hypothetical protein
MENENNSRKKIFRTTVQRAEFVDQFQRSGLTRKAFAKSHSIPVSTLNNWLTAARHVSKSRTPVLFREVSLSAVRAPGLQWAMEVMGCDGLMIRCREPLPIQDLAWLLRGR